VGNLPVTIKPKALKKLFSDCGPVESARLRSVPLDMDAKKKIPRKAAVIRGMVTAERAGANAYVVFQQAASVEAALAKNMSLVSDKSGAGSCCGCRCNCCYGCSSTVSKC
jgi:nucleolar protein 12